MSNPKILSHIAIRRAIGGLGFLLPIGLWIYGATNSAMQPSISHFYYTQAGDVLVGVLVAIGIFLLTYAGYPEGPNWPRFLPGDRATSLAAGIGAIGVALFPTSPLSSKSICETSDGIVAPCNLETEAFEDLTDVVTGIAADTTGLHSSFAILFFVALAWFCFALFPLGPRGKPERRAELWTYYISGAVILVCLVALAPLIGGIDNDSGYTVFWLESIAVWAFSVSWLVNGKILAQMPGFRDAD